jgi:putative two-component system response regulator
MTAHILIVDDDSSIRDTLVKLLAPEGYHLTTAANGMEGLQRAAMNPPDMILLDVSMPPGPNGYEVCRQLKNDPLTAHIPVTFLTFQGEPEDRQQGIEVGADDYLSKPIQHELLVTHVRAQLRVKGLIDQLEPAESVVFTLARTVEAKDHYTTGHLRRMEYYSEQLAMAAGLSQEDITAVRYGAILHDVGKIRLSESILNKRGLLTNEEFAALKRHPEYSAQMISHMRFAPRVVPIVLGHHEKWNGKGYPRGLTGKHIPIGARIVAIVDAYDAMTTDRPYRRALDQREAMNRLRVGSGKQWDPDLIDLFCALIEQRLKNPSDMDEEEALPKPPARKARSGGANLHLQPVLALH